jgi:hypothetical protein
MRRTIAQTTLPLRARTGWLSLRLGKRRADPFDSEQFLPNRGVSNGHRGPIPKPAQQLDFFYIVHEGCLTAVFDRATATIVIAKPTTEIKTPGTLAKSPQFPSCIAWTIACTVSSF